MLEVIEMVCAIVLCISTMLIFMQGVFNVFGNDDWFAYGCYGLTIGILVLLICECWEFILITAVISIIILMIRHLPTIIDIGSGFHNENSVNKTHIHKPHNYEETSSYQLHNTLKNISQHINELYEIIENKELYEKKFNGIKGNFKFINKNYEQIVVLTSLLLNLTDDIYDNEEKSEVLKKLLNNTEIYDACVSAKNALKNLSQYVDGLCCKDSSDDAINNQINVLKPICEAFPLSGLILIFSNLTPETLNNPNKTSILNELLTNAEIISTDNLTIEKLKKDFKFASVNKSERLYNGFYLPEDNAFADDMLNLIEQRKSFDISNEPVSTEISTQGFYNMLISDKSLCTEIST